MRSPVDFKPAPRLRELPKLKDGTAHLWLLDLDLVSDPPGYIRDMLSTEDLQRAARFRHIESQRRFLLCRAWLRRLLAAYTTLPLREIQFQLNPYGKPELTGQRVRFNLAHSEKMAAIAFSLDHPVGVDIEFTRNVHDLDGIASRFFSRTENAILARCNADEKETAFFRTWSCKESVIKADGRGLSLSTGEVEVLAGPVTVTELCQVKAENGQNMTWALHPFTPGPRGFGCLALRPDCIEICAWFATRNHLDNNFTIP